MANNGRQKTLSEAIRDWAIESGLVDKLKLPVIKPIDGKKLAAGDKEAFEAHEELHRQLHLLSSKGTKQRPVRMHLILDKGRRAENEEDLG
jgi:hypothetical protein